MVCESEILSRTRFGSNFSWTQGTTVLNRLFSCSSNRNCRLLSTSVLTRSFQVLLTEHLTQTKWNEFKPTNEENWLQARLSVQRSTFLFPEYPQILQLHCNQQHSPCTTHSTALAWQTGRESISGIRAVYWVVIMGLSLVGEILGTGLRKQLHFETLIPWE